ncbi:zinc finger protein with KRAB and SCAN domains 2-like isoform X2 [Coccinella septempunctata]|uniref:zinc finger protein with KRAB and SCAN domains 2-like isoform X2 n=1 Tax=Coccinella septempunctata TaxID=41139 RepID=UPI001D064221|nr:zinc finger protein with KRAB and SCAN domains 2-like isoform X2 [Coccinella septempunctata]
MPGYKVTPEQCENKFKNFKKTYKKISDDNSKSERGTLSWPFYKEMDAIFCKDPDVHPISTCSNLDGPSKSTAHPVDVEENISRIPTPQHIETNSRGVKRKRSSAEEPEWFAKFREDCQKRHEEKMEKQDHLLKILEKLVEK